MCQLKRSKRNSVDYSTWSNTCHVGCNMCGYQRPTSIYDIGDVERVYCDTCAEEINFILKRYINIKKRNKKDICSTEKTNEWKAKCSKCGRYSPSTKDINTVCNMTQPDGRKCVGIFENIKNLIK